MDCKFCKDKCQKAGKQINGQQRHYCKGCRKYQQNGYKYTAYKVEVAIMVPKLVCESVGARGISRILRTSPGGLEYYMEIQHKLPSIDPKAGVSRGVTNPYQGPGIRFQPGEFKPTLIPKIGG